jgi:predicted nucleic acid-binding protein
LSFILDTDVISEFSKRRPNETVVKFVESSSSDKLWLSVLSLGEIRRGIEVGRRRNPDAAASIARWLARTEDQFADRVLPITAEIAHRWGEITSDRARPVVDTLIAATALVHGLTVVTRNVRDFQTLGIPVINPWN